MTASVLAKILLALSCGQQRPAPQEPEQDKLHPTIRQALEKEEGPAELEILIKIASAGRPSDKTVTPQDEPAGAGRALVEAHRSFRRFVEEENIAGSFEPAKDSPFVTAKLPASEIEKLVASELVLFIGPHGEREIKDSRKR